MRFQISLSYCKSLLFLFSFLERMFQFRIRFLFVGNKQELLSSLRFWVICNCFVSCLLLTYRFFRSPFSELDLPPGSYLLWCFVFFINANFPVCSVLDLGYRCLHGVSYSVFSNRKETLFVSVLFIYIYIYYPYLCWLRRCKGKLKRKQKKKRNENLFYTNSSEIYTIFWLIELLSVLFVAIETETG